MYYLFGFNIIVQKNRKIEIASCESAFTDSHLCCSYLRGLYCSGPPSSRLPGESYQDCATCESPWANTKNIYCSPVSSAFVALLLPTVREEESLATENEDCVVFFEV